MNSADRTSAAGFWTSNDKENQQLSGTVMFSREKLGAVPENKTSSVEKKRVENKISELDLSSLDASGGVKRLAMIDPLQSMNGRSRFAKRLFVSPLQKAMSGNKRSLEMNGVDHKENERVPKRMMMDASMATPSTTPSKNDPTQYQLQTQNHEFRDFNRQERIDFLCGKIQRSTASTKLLVEREFDIFFDAVNKVRNVDESKIYDSCPEMVTKINSFLATYKMVERSLFYRIIGVHGNAFNSFLFGQNQEKCNNPTYPKTYVFFEKLRIYNGEPKSAARRFNETQYPDGFSTKKHSRKSTMAGSNEEGPPSVTHEFC